MKRTSLLVMACLAAGMLGACERQMDAGPKHAYDPSVDGVSKTALGTAPDVSILDDQRKPTPAPAVTPAASAPATEAATAPAKAAPTESSATPEPKPAATPTGGGDAGLPPQQ